LLPKENAEKFHLNLASWGQALSTWTTHKITGAKETIASLASKFHTTPDVIRQANNIPQQVRLKTGSTILVPRTSASANVADIADSVVDNAAVAFEADRGGKRGAARKQSNGQRFKAKVAELKSRVSRHSHN
jgi:membrane-bound lytic murein transglycosylase D